MLHAQNEQEAQNELSIQDGSCEFPVKQPCFATLSCTYRTLKDPFSAVSIKAGAKKTERLKEGPTAKKKTSPKGS